MVPGIVNIRNSKFTENSNLRNGPGVISSGNIDLNIFDSEFIGNKVNFGGALQVGLTDSRILIENSVFFNNQDTVYGNDIFLTGRNITAK